MHFVTSIL